MKGILEPKAKNWEPFSGRNTLITLLRIPYLGRLGSAKLVLPKWHKYGNLNRVIRVGYLIGSTNLLSLYFLPATQFV